jgi:hypothetical protein
LKRDRVWDRRTSHIGGRHHGKHGVRSSHEPGACATAQEKRRIPLKSITRICLVAESNGTEACGGGCQHGEFGYSAVEINHGTVREDGHQRTRSGLHQAETFHFVRRLRDYRPGQGKQQRGEQESGDPHVSAHVYTTSKSFEKLESLHFTGSTNPIGAPDSIQAECVEQ